MCERERQIALPRRASARIFYATLLALGTGIGLVLFLAWCLMRLAFMDRIFL